MADTDATKRTAHDADRGGPATRSTVEHSRLAGSPAPETAAERLAQSESNAPIGTTTTGAVPGGILDPNNRTIVRPSPEGDGPGRDGANTAARDQKLATDGSREAEAELGTGASADEADDSEPDSPKAKARRDRSETPDKVRGRAEKSVATEDLKLTRLGHYHPGGGEAGPCYAALVVGVTTTEKGQPDLVSLRVFANGPYDRIAQAGTGVGEDGRTVSIPVGDPADGNATTFHLSRACPYGR